jgi:hypothetical protein
MVERQRGNSIAVAEHLLLRVRQFAGLDRRQRAGDLLVDQFAAAIVLRVSPHVARL